MLAVLPKPQKKARLLLLLIFATFLLFPTPILAVEDPIGSWSTEISLPYTIASHEAFAYNKRLYVLGGAGIKNINHSEVLFAPISSDGSLSSWSIISNLPQALIWHSAVLNGNKIYILGGVLVPFPGQPNSVDTVYTATIKQDGTLSEWSALTPLPKRVADGRATIFQDKIYVIGGGVWTVGSGPIIQPDVYVANIQGDGSIDGWTSLTSLPEGRFGFSLFISNSKLIVIGGASPGSPAVDDVLFTTINPDGTIGSWQALPSFPEPSRRPGHLIIDNHFLLLGGYNGVQFLDSIYYAPVNPDGTPGTWTKSPNTLPEINCCFPLVEYNGYLYMTGGHNGVTYLSTVRKAPVSPISAPFLNVPYFSQQSPPWGSTEYNSASSWYPTDPSMARWGCTTTSAAMVLDYYDIDQIPGGPETNPGTLNEWLKSQSDGYLRNGLLNWRAITRLTRIAHDLYSSQILDFRRSGSDTLLLDTDLENSQPDILEVPGHFVVAKGKQNSTYAINDPISTANQTLEVYENTFLSMRRFIPTSTNLSALLLVIDEGVNLSFSGGNAASGSAYIENPLVDDLDGTETSGEPLQVFELPLPEDGIYSIQLSAPTTAPFTLQIYDYDSGADPTIYILQGIIYPTNPITINYEFSQSGGISFQSTAEHIRNARNLGWISVPGVANSLLFKLKAAQDAHEKGKVATSKKMLFAILAELEAQKGKQISLSAYNILVEDINFLSNN